MSRYSLEVKQEAVRKTLRESKASFAIEGEADHASRIERFADDVAAMLGGLRVFLERTQGQSPVMRSAVAAFGFVYIHPLADGNGRVHRFLINDILRRNGVLPEPVILSVSTVITDDAGERRNYDRVLDEVSKPFMQEAREHIAFTPEQTTYPDGVISNFKFNGNKQVQPVWRYVDLGPHIVYLSNLLKRTLTEHMREQSRYLRNHVRARQAIKEVVEMPDLQADRILRSIEQNNGELSNALAKQIPILSQPGVWTEIIEAVSHVFQKGLPADRHILDRYHHSRPADKAEPSR